MKYHYSLSIFLAGAVIASTAGALESPAAPQSSAVIHGVVGQVYVRKDESTEPVREGQSLAPGNQVLTVEGGQAQVVYADGCSVSLPENSLLAIGAPGQCRAGQAKVYSTAGFKEQAIGMTPAQFIAWVANTLGVSTTAATAAVVTGAGLIVGGVAYSASELSSKSGRSESEISAFLNAQQTTQAAARACNVPSYPPLTKNCQKDNPASPEGLPNYCSCNFTYCDAYGTVRNGFIRAPYCL